MMDKIIEKSFSAAAPIYDEFSSLQKRLNNALINYIDFKDDHFCNILDIGTGTADAFSILTKRGFRINFFGVDISHSMLDCARKKFSKDLFLVQSDGYGLAFKSDVFDTVMSNAVFHWTDDLENIFSEVERVLRDDGKFYFTIFGPGTLTELNDSFKAAYAFLELSPKQHIKHFKTRYEILSLLKKAGFDDIKSDIIIFKEFYTNAFRLLRWLKSIGSALPAKERSPGLAGRQLFLRMSDFYTQKFTVNGGVAATFEVFFVSARKI